MWHYKCISFSLNFYKLLHSSFSFLRVHTQKSCLFFCVQKRSTNGTKIKELHWFSVLNAVNIFPFHLFQILSSHPNDKNAQIHFTAFDSDFKSTDNNIHSFIHEKNEKTCSHCFKAKCSIFIFANCESQCSRTLFRPSNKSNVVCWMFVGRIDAPWKSISYIGSTSISQSRRWNHPLT